MSNLDLIRAWKDVDYFLSMSEAQRTFVPSHPAGLVELTDEDLENAAGGCTGTGCNTGADTVCCTGTIRNCVL